MSYSSVVLDFYDDRGASLKKFLPYKDLPEVVKTAHVLVDGSDEKYALVLQQGGETLKRFATVDAGNTWLSSLYFENTRHLLPEEAQKIAASHLAEACEHFNLPVSDSIAELNPGKLHGNVFFLTSYHKPLQKVSHEKEEIRYAIERSDGTKKFPLDNAESIAAANRYFSLNKGTFQPRDRREFSVKVASVANQYGLPLAEEILDYSGDSYSPSLQGHMTVRKQWLKEVGQSEEALEVFEKLASAIRSIEPEEFASYLEEFDRSYGIDRAWDRYVADPYRSTFSVTKIASLNHKIEYSVKDHDLTEQDLQNLSTLHKSVSDHFGGSFANKFKEQPVVMFNSMPLPQKKILARLATESRGKV